LCQIFLEWNTYKISSEEAYRKYKDCLELKK
jgi:hypothetical protein